MHVAPCCAHQESPATPLCLQPFTDNQSRRVQMFLFFTEWIFFPKYLCWVCFSFFLKQWTTESGKNIIILMKIKIKMCRNEIYPDPLCRHLWYLFSSMTLFSYSLVKCYFEQEGNKKMQQISLGSEARKLARKQSFFSMLLSSGEICFSFCLQLWLISNQRSSFHNSTLHPTHFCYCFDCKSPCSKNCIQRTFTDEQHRFTQLRSRRRFGDAICINLQVMWNFT